MGARLTDIDRIDQLSWVRARLFEQAEEGARRVSDSLKARVRAKLLDQLAADGGTDAEIAEGDDPRINAISDDLAALDDVDEDDPLIDQLATRYWVP